MDTENFSRQVINSSNHMLLQLQKMHNEMLYLFLN